MNNSPTKLTASDLHQFTGTEGYTRHNPLLFRNFISTDGVMYVADKAGAFWLLDAIASHQMDPKLRKGMLREMQFWTLKVNQSNHTAVLTCVADEGHKPAVTQEIPYTDFPLDEIKFYVQNNGEGQMVICLPSEY